MTDFWTYRARPDDHSAHELGVVDGDTLDVVADTGFRSRHAIRLRLRGVDTAETYGVPSDSEEFRRGKLHTSFTRGFVREAARRGEEWPLQVTTRKSGKYGRWLAVVACRSTGDVLNAQLKERFEVGTDG